MAQALQPFLAGVGEPLAHHIRPILATDDDVWKYWVTICLVAESKPLTLALMPELQRLAGAPTEGERAELVDILARNILLRLDRGGVESVLPGVYEP